VNLERTYTSTQLTGLIGVTDGNVSRVHLLAKRIGIAPCAGIGHAVSWSTPHAFAIVIAHRCSPDVIAARMVIELIEGHGLEPRWVLWSPVTGYARASALTIDVLWPRVPREAIEAGLNVLNLTDVLRDLEGVS